jgi:hypothetical protein
LIRKGGKPKTLNRIITEYPWSNTNNNNTNVSKWEKTYMGALFMSKA